MNELPDNPTKADIKKLQEFLKEHKKAKKKKKVKLPTILSDMQVREILATFNKNTKTGYRNYVYFLFLFKTALRSEEACKIRYEDISIVKNNNEPDQIYYRLQSSKSGYQADIPISKELHEHFINISKMYGHRQHGYIFTPVTHPASNDKMLDLSYFRRLANTIGKALEIPGGFHLHCCRHYCLSTIHRKTGDILLTQKVARHRSLNSTQIYVHVQPDQVRKATELIDF